MSPSSNQAHKHSQPRLDFQGFTERLLVLPDDPCREGVPRTPGSPPWEHEAIQKRNFHLTTWLHDFNQRSGLYWFSVEKGRFVHQNRCFNKAMMSNNGCTKWFCIKVDGFWINNDAFCIQNTGWVRISTRQRWVAYITSCRPRTHAAYR